MESDCGSGTVGRTGKASADQETEQTSNLYKVVERMIISIKMADGTRYDVQAEKMNTYRVPEEWTFVETPEGGTWLNNKYIISIVAKGEGG